MNGQKKKSDSSTRVITQQKYSLIFYYVQQLFKMNETQVTGFLNSFLLPKLFWPTVRKKLSLWLRKTFEIRGWRPRIYKIFEITRTIYSNSERSELFLVSECFFNLFLYFSHLNYYLSFDVCACFLAYVCPKKNFLMVAHIKKC